MINTHFIVAYMIAQHGTDEQKQRLLPQMATGEMRGAFSMSEPDCGSDVAAIKTARGAGRRRVRPDGQKMWLTNGGPRRRGRHAGPDRRRAPDSVYQQHDDLPRSRRSPASARPGPGLTIPGKIDKMGYKGVETTEMVLDGVRVPADGGARRRGGRGPRLLPDDGRHRGRPGQRRRPRLRHRDPRVRAGRRVRPAATTFGKPIAEHQAIAFKLAEMATKVEAAHLMMVNAARLKDSGERNDVEAGMAKLLASEYCAEVTQESFRIHGGYGYSKEYEIERLMREAPFLLIGEGTSEIQKTIISRGLLREYRA